jgi:Na+/melibiose symporter-like transporter
MLGYLAYCYFVIGFVVSFPAIATQFVFMEKISASPVEMTIAYGLIAIPWCIKPLYGYISDRYTMFDWGKRRPYIAYSGLIASYMYVIAGVHLNNMMNMVSILTITSMLICIVDVCADSITVELVRDEEHKGVIQSNNWIARASGTLCGAIFGGMAYQSYSADTVFKITAIVPFIMSIVIWKLPKSETIKDNLCSRLVDNFLEQRTLAYTLLMITVAPNYTTCYTYFLKQELGYTPVDFTYLNLSSSISFLLGIITYRAYFIRYDMKRLLLTAVILATMCRIAQLLIVWKVSSSFALILMDGIADSFCGQLIIMPLIIYTAQQCKAGVEGALFALMMSISNISSVLGDELGAFVAYLFNVSEDNFDNLGIMIVGCIILEISIQVHAIHIMFKVKSNPTYNPTELEMIDVNI